MNEKFEILYELYKNPSNYGVLKNPSVIGVHFNPLCGDKVELQLLLNEKEVLDAKFIGQGCAISQASASLLTDFLKNKSVDKIRELDLENMEELIGFKVSMGRIKCLSCALSALQKALGDKNVEN
jgi:nitrogen fixation protein NifU and related proteins